MSARRDEIRWAPLVVSLALGAGLIGLAVVCDVVWKWTGIWPSVFLEIGAGFALVGTAFALERSFIRHVTEANRETVESAAREMALDVADAFGDDGGHLHDGVDAVRIDVVPTSTAGGREPKVLVRIADPDADYKTRWRIRVTNPAGDTLERNAFWPGAGPILRARFPIAGDNRGVWSVEATRNREGVVETYTRRAVLGEE